MRWSRLLVTMNAVLLVSADGAFSSRRWRQQSDTNAGARVPIRRQPVKLQANVRLRIGPKGIRRITGQSRRTARRTGAQWRRKPSPGVGRRSQSCSSGASRRGDAAPSGIGVRARTGRLSACRHASLWFALRDVVATPSAASGHMLTAEFGAHNAESFLPCEPIKGDTRSS